MPPILKVACHLGRLEPGGQRMGVWPLYHGFISSTVRVIKNRWGKRKPSKVNHRGNV